MRRYAYEGGHVGLPFTQYEVVAGGGGGTITVPSFAFLPRTGAGGLPFATEMTWEQGDENHLATGTQNIKINLQGTSAGQNTSFTLHQISGGNEGTILYIRLNYEGDRLTVRHDIGNLRFAAGNDANMVITDINTILHFMQRDGGIWCNVTPT